MLDSVQELLEKIRLGEDNSLALKQVFFRGDKVSDPSRADLADEIAAIANSGDGVLVLGVEDKTRQVIGIPVEKLDAVESYVREICNDTIKPPVVINIFRINLPDETGKLIPVLKVDIPRSLFVHQSQGGYFYRQGSSKRLMQPDFLARLFQQRSQTRIIRFDEQFVSNAEIGCLSEELWSKFKTDLSPEKPEVFLSKLKLISKDDENILRPTVAGLLVASDSHLEYLPNAFIQAVYYRGTERNANYQIDAKDITGPLDQQIREACNFVRRNMKVFAIKRPGREETAQYSINAIFEAIVNAVAHRDYSIYGSKIRLHMFSDRIELFSPGMIPNTMTIESLSLRQSTRNELITSLLARCPVNIDNFSAKRQFMMDKRGEGVPIILSSSEELSGVKPKYSLIDNSELLLTIYAAKSQDSERRIVLEE